jgi:primosomal protein N' (replication factor Y)
MPELIVSVALPVPLRRLFDYGVPDEQKSLVQKGVRVWVPFGRRRLLGIVWDVKTTTDFEEGKLKLVESVLDSSPILDDELQALMVWMSQYYQHSLGETFSTALPAKLRKGDANISPQVDYLKLTATGEQVNELDCRRAPKQWQLLCALREGELPRRSVAKTFSSAIVAALEKKEWLEAIVRDETVLPVDKHWQAEAKPKANIEQSVAITAIVSSLSEFNCFLLEGVTGSGKTEVYLNAIASVLERQGQVLVLVPEIGLTPQMVSRFERRFGYAIGLLHSGVNDAQRLKVWQQAQKGELSIVIGTRSAVSTPFKSLGMIIVDEEHDNSYKQQDGLRYHARDVAVMRARNNQVPLVLGSATPSLQSLHNALQGRYRHLQLHNRAGIAVNTRYNLLDIRNIPLTYGLSSAMVTRIKQHLDKGNQVMIFINRRGYAPALVCHECGWVAECPRCSRSFTLHKAQRKLHCHHCDNVKPIPTQCHQCHSHQILPLGQGTEQLQEGLSQLFPGYQNVRIDSDSVRGKGRLNTLFEQIHQNEFQLLVGTQILAKGHHFPRVTLVVLLDVDGALFSADFRATEHLAQLITQVAGRAGRAEREGEMWLQTYHPEHPMLQDLINNGYQHFSRLALQERQQAQLPPFCYQVLLRAQAPKASVASDFLLKVRRQLPRLDRVTVLGPLPALMEKRQGQYRMQMLLQSSSRALLQKLLTQLIPTIELLPESSRVRWSVDVDPQDFS